MLSVSDQLVQMVRAALGRTTAPEDLERILPLAMGVYNQRAIAGSASGLPPVELPAAADPAVVRALEAELDRIGPPPRLITQVSLEPDPDGGSRLAILSLDLGASPSAIRRELSKPATVVQLVLLQSTPAHRVPALLEPLHSSSARKALRVELERLGPALDQATADRLALAFRIVGGVGRQSGPLLRLLELGALSAHARELLEDLLATDAPAQLLATEGGLDAMARRLLESVLATGDSEPVLSGLELTPPEGLEELVRELERVREETGPSAAVLWGPGLQRPGLEPVHSLLVELIGSEGTASSRDWVAGQQGVLPLPLAHGASKAARAAEQPRGAPARAWLGAPDGQSAFQVFVAQRGRGDRQELAAAVCRGNGTVRDGFTMQLGEQELRALIERIDETTPQVSIPAAQAAHLVAEARARADGPLELDPRAVMAVDRILLHADPSWAPAPPAGEGSPTDADVDGLFATTLCDSWFFDHADVRRAGGRIPTPGEDRDAWAVETRRAIATEDLVGRVRAMCSLLATWLDADGQGPLAARLARCGEELTLESFPDHPVIRSMVQESFDVLLADPMSSELEIGDPGYRLTLAAHPALRSKTPRNRHLAALDLAEVLTTSEFDFVAVSADFADVPTERRSEGLIAAAGVVAAELFRAFARAPSSRDEALADVGRALATHMPELTDPAELAGAVFDRCLVLCQEVCTGCPVQCWTHPNRRVRRLWITGAHPAMQ